MNFATETNQNYTTDPAIITDSENRIPLTNGTELHLKTSDNVVQKYIIDDLISDRGSSCLCYRVHLKAAKKRSFVLKEFYPKGKGVIRKSDSKIDMPSELSGDLARFEASVEVMKRISLENAYRHNVVGDILILHGNGTSFCRNEDYTGGRTWDQIEDHDFIQVLTCMKAIMRLLDHMHGSEYRYVYMDLKPENILLRASGSGILYDEPVFVDFDSVLTTGMHRLEETHTTAPYRPEGIIPRLTTGNKKRLKNISAAIDQYSFGILLKIKTEPFWPLLNVATQEACNTLIADLIELGSTGKGLPLGDVVSRIDEIIKLYNKPRQDMCKNSYDINKTKFNLLYKIVLPITVAVCIGLSAVYAFLVNQAGTAFSEPFRGNIGLMVFLAIMLLSFTVFSQGLKILLIYFASQQYNAKVASEELEKETCGSDITQYFLGNWKDSAFREGEDSIIHNKRQRRRRLLWIVLGASLIIALAASIRLNEFPVFLILGSLFLIFFMYADCIPSNHEFYKKACSGFSNDIQDEKISDERACFFEYEYEETGGTFDLSSDYYLNDELNLYQLKNKLSSQGGMFKTSFGHETKQRIYSMAIDRERNFQLIMGIVLVVLNSLVLMLDLMLFFGLNTEYFMLPLSAYSFITYIAIVINLAANIVQVYLVSGQEHRIAQLAFNSKFLEEKELENRLGKDILRGLVKNIDVVRGVYQYDAYLYSKPERLSVSLKDKLQLHHVDIANRGRLAITIWLLFCMAFSWMVWMRQVFITLPLLLIGTALLHYCLSRFILPYWSRKTMCRRIKRFKATQEKENA